MRTVRSTQLHLLIFMIVDNCLMKTDCADSGRKRDVNVYATSFTPRARKLRHVEGDASTSKTPIEADSSIREKILWPRKVEEDILSTYFNNFRGSFTNWDKVFTILRSNHPALPDLKTTQSHIYNLVKKILHNTQAWGEGNVLWTKKMKYDAIRIYYQTKNQDETEHAREMYIRWRIEHPIYPDISPRYLLHQAENMLIRNGLLEPSKPLSNDRFQKIFADKVFKFNSEQEDLLCKMYMKMPPLKPVHVENFYTELCGKDSKFYRASPQKLFMRARYLLKEQEKQQQQQLQVPDEDHKETDSLNRGHHFHEFIDIWKHPPVHQRSLHHHAKELGDPSSHNRSKHDHLDLDLRLGSLKVHTPRIRHPNLNLEIGTPRVSNPDVDLELSLSSQKKKGKLI